MSLKQRSLSVSSQTPPHQQIHQAPPELVTSVPDTKNWRGMGIAFLVIVAVCSLIVTAVVLLNPGPGADITNARFSIDDVISDLFKPRLFNGTWLTETLLLYRDADGALITRDAETGVTSILMSNITFRQHNVQKYDVSPDRKYILLFSDMEKRFSYSVLSVYKVFNVETQQVFPLLRETPSMKLQHVQWGKRGSQMVYIYKNNIYYIAEFGSSPRPIVLTGSDDVYNGITDWTYEERIFDDNRALWWSEDGGKLCYASFDDTEVNISSYIWYGHYDNNNIATNIRSFRYPKPGTAIPKVTLWVVNLDNLNTQQEEVLPPREIRYREHYLTGVRWVDNSRLAITWMKRAQNHSYVSMCEEKKKWECIKHIEETGTGYSWVDMAEAPIFTEDKRYYFLRLPVTDGEAGSFYQVTMVPLNSMGIKTYLTHGQRVVTKVLAHSSQFRTVYYLATNDRKPGQQHLYAVTDTFAETPKDILCVTCTLDPRCTYNSAVFSPKARFYVLVCEGPGVPRVELRATDSHRLVHVLDRNEDLKDLLDSRALPLIRTFQIPIEGGYNAVVRLYLPPGLNEEEITKYPVVLHVDASPGSQLVLERFSIDWGTYLSSKKNFIHAIVDGRGCGNYGNRRTHELYRRLGNVEVKDQIEVIRYLSHDLPFIDEGRIAVWGWGYGGYAAAMTVATDVDVFQCALAVAPITTWRYYDAVFTERYMGMPTPEDNYVGYEKSEVVRKSANLVNKKLLLIHGTADKLVQLPHSMMLMKSLVDAQVAFRTQLYPDEEHDLRNVRLHLYKTMEDFLDQCFLVENEDDFGLQQSKSIKSV